MSLNDKVAIVTGASSGIGAAIAEKFSHEGAHVVMVGRNETKLSAVAARCNYPLVIKAELDKEEDIVKIIDETIKKLGKIDILVNNAGTNVMGSFLEGDVMKSYDRVMNINFKAVAHLTQLATPHLIKTKGNIVNIASVAGTLTSQVPKMLVIYACSKAAVIHLTKHAALELAAHKVRVNAISPGPVRTDLMENTGTPIEWDDFKDKTVLDRVSEPVEIADLALFLASEKGKGITGSNYVTDNGMSL